MIKRIAITFAGVILGVIIVPFIAYSDYPHTGPTSEGINCTSCHVVHGPLPSWATQTAISIDDTSYNNLCLSCHNDSRAPREQVHSSLTTSTKYGNWTVECRTCHNPHKQEQVEAYGSDAYLFSGTITSVTTNTITNTGAGWIASQWKGMLVIGDTSLATPIFYKITDNTAESLTVEGALTNLSPGKTFAIVYGRPIKNTITYTKTNLTSTVTISSPVKFFNNNGTNSFSDGSSIEAICVVCHTQTQFHKNDGTGEVHNPGSNCLQCHPHESGFKPTVACDTCHGDPPTSATYGGPSGLVGALGAGDTGILSSSTATPTSIGAHNTHVNTRGMSCDVCHYQQTSGDNTMSFGFYVNSMTFPGWGSSSVTTGTLSLRTPNSPFTFQGYAGTTVNSVSSYANTCSSVYCHGSTLAGGSNTTPSWVGTNQAACGSCHSTSTGAGAPTLGSHTTHAGTLQLACTTCHPSVTDNSHVNGSVAWSVSSSDPRTNGGTYRGQVSGSTGNLAPSGTYGSCSNLYCHSTVQGSNGSGSPGSYASPQWGNNNLNCGSCHADMANDVSAPGSHKKHAQDNGYACSRCHTGAGDGTGKHADMHVDIAFDSLNPSGAYSLGSSVTPGSGYGTCSATYCHGSGASPQWGNSGSTNCASCHGASNNGDLSTKHAKHYASATAPINRSATNAHTDTGYVFGCGNCHPNGTTHATGPVTSGVRDAEIGGINLTQSNYTPAGTHTTDGRNFNFTTYGTCATVCHTKDGSTLGSAVTGNPTWNSTNSVGCGFCHNKAGDATPTWSSPHTKHINTYNANAASPNTNLTCNACHSITASDSSTINGATGRAQHPNGVKNVDLGSFATGTYVPGTGCSATYCHSQGTIFTGSYTQKAVQSWSGNTTCASCHDDTTTGPSYTSGSPKANSHNKHVVVKGFVCVDCHAATVNSSNQIIDPSKHVNKTYDILGSSTTITYTYASDGGTCATACHYTSTPKWGTSSTGCNFCHLALPTSGSHAFHVKTAATVYGSTTATTTGGNYDFGCGNCHPKDPANHGKGTVQLLLTDGVAGDTLKSKNTATASYDSTAKVCSAVYCHSNGAIGANSNLATATSPTWGVAYSGDECAMCHGNSPASGSHGNHVLAGIHYKNIFTGTIGIKPADTRSDIENQDAAVRPHGNSSTSTPINCNICHSATVSVRYNALNSQCSGCHNTTGGASTGDAVLAIDAGSANHLNGQVDVVVMSATVLSKAQLRSEPRPWTRNNGYKSDMLASGDFSTIASGDWSSSDKTCTTACHLNQKSPVWGAPATCSSCHKSLSY